MTTNYQGFIQKLSFGVEVGVAFCMCHISYTLGSSYQRSRYQTPWSLSLPPSLPLLFLPSLSLPRPFLGGKLGCLGGKFPPNPSLNETLAIIIETNNLLL